MSIKTDNRVITIMALLGAMVLWASSFVALKYAFMSYDSMVVIFTRMLIALIFVLIFFRKAFIGLEITKNDLKYLFIMALFEPCIYFILEAEALVNTTASQAGMVTTLLPVMVAIGAWIWIGEKITKSIVIGGLIAFVGAMWLSIGADSSDYAPRPFYGNSMEFLAMVTAVGYTLTLKHLSKRFKPLFLTAFQALIGSLFFFVFLLLPSTTMPTDFPLEPSLAVLYLGIGVSFGAYGLYNYGVSKIPASEASLYVNLIPVFTVLLAYILLDEQFGWHEVIGASFILVGVFIAQYKGRAKDKV